jgi:hypothetical protein
MKDIIHKLDAVLRAEGFSMLEAKCEERKNCPTVNRLVYMDSERDQVYLHIHEPRKEEEAI